MFCFLVIFAITVANTVPNNSEKKNKTGKMQNTSLIWVRETGLFSY